MEKTAFYNLIENPGSVSEIPIDTLNNIIINHPWFASVYLLKVKQSQLQNNADFENILSSSAVYSNNRIALFELIYSTNLKKNNPENIVDENSNIEKTVVEYITAEFIPIEKSAAQKDDFENSLDAKSIAENSIAEKTDDEYKETENIALENIVPQETEKELSITEKILSEKSLAEKSNTISVDVLNTKPDSAIEISLSKPPENKIEIDTASANEISKTEKLLKLLVAKEKLLAENDRKEIFDELIFASEVESNFQFPDYETDEVIVAGDHEEEGILAVENAVRNLAREDFAEEFEAVSQSGNLDEHSTMVVDEDNDEPEFDKNEVELESTKFLTLEIERNETDEAIKDSEINSLSLSEYSHKNEDYENEKEGIAQENIASELESLVVLEAQNATEIIKPNVISEKISLENLEQHTFLSWLKKLAGTTESNQLKPLTDTATISENANSLKSRQRTEDEVLIDFIPDHLPISNEEDIKVIDNFVLSIKFNKNEPKQSSVIDRAKKSLLNTDDMVTETLAKILTSQNKFQSAINMYEKLRLKFPAKSHYFAALIKELKTKI